MRIAFGIALATGLIGGAMSATAADFGKNVAVGNPAPAFSAPSADGKTVSLADYKGKIVVLEWTNNGCPFVRANYESGAMQKAQQAAATQGVVWLTILSSAPGTQGYLTADQAKADIAKEKASPSAYLLDPDGKVGKLYGAKTTPHMFVITPDQKIAYMGAIDDKASATPGDHPTANNYVLSALKNLAQGQPAQPASTTPYGCSVKYAS